MRYEYYKSKKDGDWYWRYIKNGEQISRSSEGYRNKADCLRGIEIMKDSKNAPEVETDE